MTSPFDSVPAAVDSCALHDALPIDESARAALLPFFTVAIGASAGGVEALLKLFGCMPADTGCAFVVVLHMAPERESLLAQLIARVTSMPVVAATQDLALVPNQVHIIVPGQFMTLRDGCLQLEPMGARPPHPVTVDRFMMSLAAEQRERAVGVVLTGADGDGALGIKAIKAEGGLTLAQTPATAAHPGMPESAVATGLVDRALAIEEIPPVLLAYVQAAGLQLPAEPAAAPAQYLPAMLAVVRSHTGLDFCGYKEPMLLRRIHRRMGLTRRPDRAAYLELLRDSAEEARALADDFLISVTEFFREPESWQALSQQVLPELLARKQPGESLRVWVPACASGEEAYSLAMSLLERPELTHKRLTLQVFGTDIDRDALDVARKGRYAQAIEHTVAPARLQRFFQRTEQGWQVHKELREALMFAPHNVISDPPFLRMDLVSCRNLLIYMEPELQRRVLQMLHFALEAHGILVLGKSETAHALDDAFAPVAQGLRLFRRLGVPRTTAVKLSSFGLSNLSGFGAPHAQRPARAPDYGQLMREALLEHRAAAAILVSREASLLYMHGPLESCLELPEGVPTVDLFAMVRDGLRPVLRAALHKAWNERIRVECVGAVRLGDTERPVRLVASPIAAPGQEVMLVSFELLPPSPKGAAVPMLPLETGALQALEDELRQTRQELRSTIEELESANEELKVANEEAMSMNEELQSSNEELQTSKEELQAVNEELSTVNSELQGKVAELEKVNNDLCNLLSSTHTPTLFLDRQLHIKRFTPAATRLFSLLPGDIDRALADITSRIDLTDLLDDAQQVLTQLAPAQREMRSSDGGHFLCRVLPYRTQEDRIDGIVVTFTDITEIRRAAEGLRRYAAVMQGSSDAIVMHDLGGRIVAWNAAAQAMYGHAPDEVIGMDISGLLPEAQRAEHGRLMQRLLAGERLQPDFETYRRRRDGGLFDVSCTVTLVQDEAGQPAAFACIERDITPRKRAEQQLRESEQRFRSLADSAPVLIWVSDAHDVVAFANRELCNCTGLTLAQLTGRSWLELLHPDDRPGTAQALQRLRGQGENARVEAQARLQVRQGGVRWMKLTVLCRSGDGASQAGFIGSMVDIDEQVRAERELREADRRKDEFLAMLGHELRNPLVPIRNAAEVLNHVPDRDARIDWVRETVVRQVEHVTRLVDDLVDISLIMRRALQLHREPVELQQVLQRAVEATGAFMQRRRHHFAMRPAPLPLWVEADVIRLTQVFENLLTNAAKYTNEEGAIAVTVDAEARHAVVRVRDNGLGLSPAMQSQAFELFMQDERAVDRSQGGLGTGLALVRYLVELHGGQVQAYSDGLGHGSEFTVRLPLLPSPLPNPAQPDDPAPGSVQGRVLVVDDDVDATESLGVLLRLYGYEVALAHDLDSALQAAQAFRPDVALLDVAMPGADGYEVAQRLRALPALGPALPCIAISGFGQPEDLRRSERAGFARHLIKPVDPAALNRIIRTLLNQ